MTLHTTINNLAAEFAHHLLAAVRHASLDEILAETGAHRLGRVRRARTVHGTATARRKRIRRSPEQLQNVADKIIAIIKAHPKGINAEAIKVQMGIKSGNVGAKVFTKPLAVALASKKIAKRGSRRATTYFVTTSKPTSPSA